MATEITIKGTKPKQGERMTKGAGWRLVWGLSVLRSSASPNNDEIS